ncbi:MAG: hypothetical protein CL760_11445 [Chloroflexi bacterium]|nr:hypothetical protein [Chloroflexota bacterium]|tara:strand:+ start:9304 stop:10104 length:801 start_codon:yes stop_codon:yes gene_type:complete
MSKDKKHNLQARLKDHFKSLPTYFGSMEMSYVSASNKDPQNKIVIQDEQDVFTFVMNMYDEDKNLKDISEQYMVVVYKNLLTEESFESKQYFLEEAKELLVNSRCEVSQNAFRDYSDYDYCYDKSVSLPIFMECFFAIKPSNEGEKELSEICSEDENKLKLVSEERDQYSKEYEAAKEAFEKEFEEKTLVSEIEAMERELAQKKSQQKNLVKQLKSKHNLNHLKNLKKAKEEESYHLRNMLWKKWLYTIKEKGLKINPKTLFKKIK